MLSASKLKELCSESNVNIEQLAGHMTHGGFDKNSAVSALRNWQKGLYKPAPNQQDVERLAKGLGVETNEISEWRASCRYAPFSASKARLVTQLISSRNVQDALDVLSFANKRAAVTIKKVLQSAIANADEQQADVDSLYVKEARVDQAGRRIGTKGWIAKDRGRAHPIRKEACHIHITVAEE